MDVKKGKMNVRWTAFVVTFFALAVALSYKIYIRCVETSLQSSTEQLEPQVVDKTKLNTRLQFAPIARGSAEGGLHLLKALNDAGIGAMMNGNRSVTLYVPTAKKAEAIGVLDKLGRKDLWFVQEFK